MENITNSEQIKALGDMTPVEWMKINYNLKIDDSVEMFHTKEKKIITRLKWTDNIGHFRTNYPVVIGFKGESMLLKDSTNWLTIEEAFGY